MGITANTQPASSDPEQALYPKPSAPPRYDDDEYNKNKYDVFEYVFYPQNIYHDLPKKKTPTLQAAPDRVSNGHTFPVLNYSPLIINNNVGNRYDSRPAPRRPAEEKMSQNAAIGYSILLSLSALTLLPYGIRAAYKAVKNLIQGQRPLNTLWRLYTMITGGVIGLIKGASLGAAIGSALPGLGTTAGAVIGAICCPLIGLGTGALVGKYTAKAVSWLNAREDVDVSFTNHNKWKLSETAKNYLEAGINSDQPAAYRQNTLTHILTRLRDQKNAWGMRGYIPFSEESRSRELGNHTLRLIQSGRAPFYDSHGRYLFWESTDKHQALALHLDTKQWVEGRVVMRPVNMPQ